MMVKEKSKYIYIMQIDTAPSGSWYKAKHINKKMRSLNMSSCLMKEQHRKFKYLKQEYITSTMGLLT